MEHRKIQKFCITGSLVLAVTSHGLLSSGICNNEFCYQVRMMPDKPDQGGFIYDYMVASEITTVSGSETFTGQ